ncbi:MAG: alpha/beta fold hydrolase [Dehalococcoidia bacterium]
MANQSKKTWIVLVISLLLILVGDLLASCIQTDWGNVQVKDIRFMATDNTDDTSNVVMSALLYVPRTATAANPAPGILAIHGYINSRETQDGFAIEFARRGYVVLAIDQTGHGYSSPPAFANGYGGPDGLKYLAGLDIVDKNNIGLEGHSMGGWAIGVAAGAHPDLYKAMVLEGSSTGTAGSPEGDANFPHNLGLVYSLWDEFSNNMWTAAIPRDIVSTDKLKEQFDTDKDVVVGQLYGSIEKGTARELWMPQNTHPGDHFSTAAIGDAIYWFQQTLKGGNGLPPANQVWYWKEIGNLIALIGMILLLFPVGSLLLQTPFFKGLAEATPEPRTVKGVGWWIGAILLIVIPVVTYFPFTELGIGLFVNPVFQQTITNQIMVWALLNAAISIVLFVLWHFIWNRKANAGNYGLAWGTKLAWGKIGKALLLAVAVAFVAYLTLALSALLFTVDYRIWVFAVKPMSLLQFQLFLSYLIPFFIFFLVLATVLQGELRPLKKDGQAFGLCGETWINIALLVVGFVGLLLFQYIPLMAGGTLAIPTENLFSIIAFQFLPIMTIAALVFTYFFRKTGHVYAGVFLTAILIVWIVVASQAIHFG